MGLLEQLRETRGKGRITPPDDEASAKAYPNLWEMLTVDRWANGEERVLPTITLSRVPGGFRVVLTDDALLQRKDTACLTLEGVWAALEAMLLSETPWTPLEKSYRNKKGLPVEEEKKPGRKKH